MEGGNGDKARSRWCDFGLAFDLDIHDVTAILYCVARSFSMAFSAFGLGLKARAGHVG